VEKGKRAEARFLFIYTPGYLRNGEKENPIHMDKKSRATDWQFDVFS
jgi:hypothetical protein